MSDLTRNGRDLVAFLRARLDEDETEAQADEVLAHEQATGWLPERVLREVEAKRRIVTEMERIQRSDPSRKAQAAARGWNDAIHYVTWELAQPYADHPDYDEAWRP